MSNNDHHTIPNHVLDDICTRFIINIPQHERENLVRLCFQIELAHWFYMDFICIEDKTLETCSLKQFIQHIFQHISWLRQNLPDIDDIIKSWRSYKQSVPTHGAIILDKEMTHVLLVQGYYAKNSWMFPKGKVNENELPHVCAAREVFEEVGYDISKSIDPSDFIESTFNDQLVRLYIVPGVDRFKTEFQTKTRNEIKFIQWFPITDLPATRNQIVPYAKNTFFMVVPFVKPLRRWIWNKTDRSQGKQPKPRARHQSTGAETTEKNKRKTSKDNVKPKNSHNAQFCQNELRDLLPAKNKSGSVSPVKGKRNRRFVRRDKDNSGEIHRSNSLGSYPGRNKQKLSEQPTFIKKIDKIVTGNDKDTDVFNFSAPSWVNFHLDTAALLKGL